MPGMEPHPLGNFLGKIWTKVIKIWANLIRFGQNQNLASPKSFDLLRLCYLLLMINFNLSRQNVSLLEPCGRP